jgi:Permuted papain-like amidase enzyme, YaeF/YiiX, C92 family
LAQHIDNLKTCSIAKVDKADFYREVQPGDLLFVSGVAAISHGIQLMTGSPWSHVAFVWCPESGNQRLTIEATIDRGVHVGLLKDYVDGSNAAIALGRTRALTLNDQYIAMNAGLGVLDDGYDWQQEVSITARKLVGMLPLIQPKKEFYCSGLQYFMRLGTSLPLQKPQANMPTPEDNWTDPSVEAVCLMVKG